MFSKLWGYVKNFFRGCANFFRRHFHKAVAVMGAGAVMCTLEILGLVAADMLLLPLAMVSLVGLILLCFAYFLVIFATITVGMEVFTFLWDKCQLKEVDYKAQDLLKKTKDQEPITVDASPSTPDATLGAAVAAAAIAHA